MKSELQTSVTLQIVVKPENTDLCGEDCPYLLPARHLRHLADNRFCDLFRMGVDGRTRPMLLNPNKTGIKRNVFCLSAEVKMLDKIAMAKESATGGLDVR